MNRDTERNSFKNKVTIPNPLIIQILTYFVVMILCCITLLCCLWAAIVVISEGFVSIGGIPVIIFFAGYSSYVGILVSRYKSARVTYHENGFTVTHGRNSKSYSWEDMTKPKYFGMFQVLKLHDTNGRTIYTIHGNTRAAKKFIQKVGKEVGFTTDVF
ncbi:hypothetical protein [Reichenbachiella versicolor]|uniref:hypothetical protein n=1 Tax=Reichenbachiella versicolor TaxID=1821036 RepID=UPI000D6E4C06|nr:hypothetical protein [Reichenbachiella versicolor]